MITSSFRGIQVIDLFGHSYQPVGNSGTAGFGVFSKGSATEPAIVNANTTGSFTAMTFEGNVTVLKPFLKPLPNFQTYQFGRTTATNTVYVEYGKGYVNGMLVGMAGTQKSPYQWMSFSQPVVAGASRNAGPIPYAYGPLDLLSPGNNLEHLRMHQSMIFEACYLGLPFACTALSWFKTPENVNYAGKGLLNNTLYPQAASENSILSAGGIGIGNGHAWQLPVPSALQLGFIYRVDDGSFVAANAPDYLTGWNYSIHFLNYTTVTPTIYLSKWAMVDPNSALWEQIYDTVQFETPPGGVPIDPTYFGTSGYINVQSCRQGFIFHFSKGYLYKGVNYYCMFVKRDCSRYVLLDFNYTFTKNDLNPGAGTTPFVWGTNTFNVAVDRYGYFYTANNVGSFAYIGCSRAPLFQNALPVLEKPDIIPTYKLGCYNPCNSFPTYPVGNP